ncbi:MAG TPA: class I SAM-dependent methyltransferase [Kiritimatiellia bacterium]|nr:class I SAM-dependent methyltransferase [Kiritimatiellia bacterium]
MSSDYQLLDSGHGQKLERFGPVTLVRPCSQAVWPPRLPPDPWTRAHATFDRAEGNRWSRRNRLPDHWDISVDGIRFKLSSTDFGHLGIFPEQRQSWAWIRERLAHRANTSPPPAVLNLFAYSGGSTLAAAHARADVCHVDASKGMVEWARENAKLNQLQAAPIRWIVDDVHKFLHREIKRNRRYDAIILDPPTFGRGAKGELYKIEEALPETLTLCSRLLTSRPLFLLLSAHTPGFTPIVLENLLRSHLPPGHYHPGEMLLTGDPDTLPLPSGTYCRWTPTGVSP